MFSLLGRVVLLAIAISALAANTTTTTTTTTQTFDCRPGQSCWPTINQWQAFNRTVSGHLQVTAMLGSPCFPRSPDFNAAACANVEANYFNGTFREQIYGSMEIPEWEACGAANCYPALVAPQAPICSLGRMSAYYVDAETAGDITATLEFIKAHNMRLVIRNTGHDYLGRTDKENIGVIGAGVVSEDLSNFFLTYGMMATVGSAPSVGTAGGFGQGGGHGPLGPSFGLMVDQAVEFDVVTTDGVARTINQCNDPDLFWAMRGGAGQSYAILTGYKFQLHPVTQFAAFHFQANISATARTAKVTDNAALRDILTALANNQTTWSANHIAGYDILSPASVEFLEILPAAGDPLSVLRQLTADFEHFLTSHPDLEIGLNSYTLFSNGVTFLEGEAEFIARAGSSGLSVITPSRLIPREQFATPSSIDSLVGGVLAGMEIVATALPPAEQSQVVFVAEKTAPINTPDAGRATSANPAWRDTLWHYITAAAWVPGTSDAEAANIRAAARAALVPVQGVLSGQAAYTNEADPAEPNWQDVFYGANFDRLVAVKQRYDPGSVLNCWKCPGWLGPQDPMYSCYSDNPVPSVPATGGT